MTGWHKEDIKAALRKKYGSMEAWAARENVSSSMVRRALLVPSPKIDRKISKALGVPLSGLWPERYDVCGKRHKRSTASTSSSHAVRENKRTGKTIPCAGEVA